MGQLGIRLVNVALFVLACFLAAGVFNRIVADRLAPDAYTHTREAPAIEIEQPSWEERKTILDRNLFGAKVAEPQKRSATKTAAKPPPPPPPEVKVSKLPLKLLGTMAAQPASLSTAVIMNTRSRKHEVVQEGDHIKEHEAAVVLSIERRRVILQNGAAREELILEESKLTDVSPKTKPARGKKRGARRPRRAARRPARAKPPPAPIPELPAEAKDALSSLRSTRELLSNARLLPSYNEEGGMEGVKISSIKPGSLFDIAGLQDGDVISTVNGIAIDSPQASTKVLAEMSNADEIQLEGTRDGQPFSESVPSIVLEAMGK